MRLEECVNVDSGAASNHTLVGGVRTRIEVAQGGNNRMLTGNSCTRSQSSIDRWSAVLNVICGKVVCAYVLVPMKLPHRF